MSLQGLHILNTRPGHQAQELSARLRAAGARVSELPLIAIQPLEVPAPGQRLLMDLDRHDGVIFVSANAVRLGLQAIADYWPQWPWGLPAYAVGQSTAALLELEAITVRQPEARANSEGLLALPELQQVAGQRFLLMRGEGGRELLADTLCERGAHVDALALYRRTLPEAASAQWVSLSGDSPDVVVLTSPDALKNWQAVAGHAANKPLWLVVSARMRADAEAACARVCEAFGADVDSLVQALLDLEKPH